MQKREETIIEILYEAGPIPQNKLVELAKEEMSQNTVKSTLKELVDKGKVIETPVKNMKVYQLEEPLTNRKEEFGERAAGAIKQLETMAKEYQKYPPEIRHRAFETVRGVEHFSEAYDDAMTMLKYEYDKTSVAEYDLICSEIYKMVQNNDLMHEKISDMVEENSEDDEPVRNPLQDANSQLTHALSRGQNMMQNLQKANVSIRQRLDKTAGSMALKRNELVKKLDGVQKHSDDLVSYAMEIKRAVAVSEKEIECVQNSHLGDGDEDRAWRHGYTKSGQDHQNMLYTLDHTLHKVKDIRNEFSGAHVAKIVPKTGSHKKVIGDLDNIITSMEKMRVEADKEFIKSMYGNESETHEAVAKLNELVLKIEQNLDGDYREFRDQ